VVLVLALVSEVWEALAVFFLAVAGVADVAVALVLVARVVLALVLALVSEVSEVLGPLLSQMWSPFLIVTLDSTEVNSFDRN
jgi:hypothetical protein